MWKCEGLFAEAKENHNLARARYRGRPKVQIQAYLIAMVQNLKRLVIAFYLWLLARSLLDQFRSNRAPASRNQARLFQQARWFVATRHDLAPRSNAMNMLSGCRSWWTSTCLLRRSFSNAWSPPLQLPDVSPNARSHARPLSNRRRRLPRPSFAGSSDHQPTKGDQFKGA